jgi:hypothetical protein
MQMVAALEALDRAPGARAEDPVGVQAERTLQHPDGWVVIAGVQRAARGGGRRKRERAHERDHEKMS